MVVCLFLLGVQTKHILRNLQTMIYENKCIEKNQDQLEQDMGLPFGFVVNGLEDENIGQAIDEYGTRWSPVIRIHDGYSKW